MALLGTPEGKGRIMDIIEDLPGELTQETPGDIRARLLKTSTTAWGSAVERISLWAQENNSGIANVAWRLFHTAAPSPRGSFVEQLIFFAPAMREVYLCDPPPDSGIFDVALPLAKRWPFLPSSKVWPLRSSFWIDVDSDENMTSTKENLAKRLAVGDGHAPGSQLGQGIAMYSAAPGAVLTPTFHIEDHATPLVVALLQVISLAKKGGLSSPKNTWQLFAST